MQKIKLYNKQLKTQELNTKNNKKKSIKTNYKKPLLQQLQIKNLKNTKITIQK